MSLDEQKPRVGMIGKEVNDDNDVFSEQEDARENGFVDVPDNFPDFNHVEFSPRHDGHDDFNHNLADSTEVLEDIGNSSCFLVIIFRSAEIDLQGKCQN